MISNQPNRNPASLFMERGKLYTIVGLFEKAGKDFNKLYTLSKNNTFNNQHDIKVSKGIFKTLGIRAG